MANYSGVARNLVWGINVDWYGSFFQGWQKQFESVVERGTEGGWVWGGSPSLEIFWIFHLQMAYFGRFWGTNLIILLYNQVEPTTL